MTASADPPGPPDRTAGSGPAPAERLSWGFVGLGEMGEPMVEHLLAAGLPVRVCDSEPRRLETAVRRGATAGPVADLAADCDVVALCVRDGEQAGQVVAAVLAAGPRPGLTVVVHSTVGPDTCRSLAALLAERGIDLVDAPVSGMRMAAAAGTLTFFVGGEPAAVDRVRPGLAAMGTQIVDVGGVGAGQAVKLANNLVAFGTVALVREAAAIGAASGVAPEPLLDALSRGSARSWVVENWEFLTADWPDSQPGGVAAVRDIVAKDLTLAADAGATAPFAELAARIVPDFLGGPRPAPRSR